MTAPKLAKLAIAVLDAQKRYFKTRNREDMLESMRLEKQLRTAAEGVVAAEAVERQTTLTAEGLRGNQ